MQHISRLVADAMGSHVQFSEDKYQQGPRDRLRRTAGAAAPSGGREPHEVGDRGG